MAYAAITDVQAQNPNRTYDANSKPTQTQVTGFIDKIAGEIDTILATRQVATPVATPSGFVDYLKNLNALGAAALAEMAAFPEQDTGQGATPNGDRLWAMYRDGLNGLMNGSAIHPDAPLISSDSGLTARSYGTDHPDETTSEPPLPRFSMGQSF